MAQELITPKIPDSFKGLLTNSKLVQQSILERTEKKLSVLEGRNGVVLYSRDRSPPSLNSELDIFPPNFIALGESYFIVKFKYTVKDNRNAGAQSYPNWICTTSPCFSFFKSMRLELNGTEVTQSSKVADMAIPQHIISLMESSVARLQYSDSDAYSVQKLDPRMALKDIPLGEYQYGVKRKRAFAFASNEANGDDFDDTADDYTVKRRPGVERTTSEGFSNTVQESVVRPQSGKFEYKMRPFVVFFNNDDAWLPPGTQVKIRCELPQAQLSRYLIISDNDGGQDDISSVGDVQIELLKFEYVYPTYWMDSAYVDQVRLAKQLYFHTWCPRLVQKSITDDAGTLELLHNADIPRQFVLFFSDLKMGDEPTLGTGNATHLHNRLAMIHADLSQLRMTVNDEALFDSPLKFDWECSQIADGTYYYDYKSSYLRGYNQVRDFFGKTYSNEIPLTALEYCNNYFMIPVNLNLDGQVDNRKI